MYYEDLSAYTYYDPRSLVFKDKRLIKAFGSDSRELRLVNFGWLDPAHPFPTGDIVREEVEKLASLCRAYNGMSRGFHLCEFCYRERLQESPSFSKADMEMLTFSYKSHNLALGSAEIWIKGNSNTVYIAPNLVLHYIAEHSYRMPDEVKAALKEMGNFSLATALKSEDYRRSRRNS